MAVIFVFSTSLFGGQSTGSIIEAVVRFVYPGASAGLVDALNISARKSAHFTEYAVLALLWHRALAKSGRPPVSTFAATLVICVLYAASDELHQAFVPGRTPSAMDAAVDSAGAAAMLAWLWAKKTRTPIGARR